MVGLTNRSAQGVLDHITGKTSLFTLATPGYVSLFSSVGVDAGTGFTEVSGGNYGRASRAATDWAAAVAGPPASAATSTTTSFNQSSAAWASGANLIAFGYHDASTAGNLLAWDYLGSGLWMPFSCTSASPGVITCPGHGFSNGDLVAVTAEFGGTLPTGMSASSGSTLLTVAGVSGDTFNLGTNTTSTGNGFLRKVVPLAVASANITPTIASGSLVLTLA